MNDSFASEFRRALQTGFDEWGIEVLDEQQARMLRFAQMVLEGNERLNLTRITEPQEMAIKHFVDSLACLLVKLPAGNLRCIDVGTGAGFPGVPLAICRPGWDFILLDSLKKKLSFIDEALDALGITNARTLHARAEDAGQDHELRGQFDLVVSRAVAWLPILVELCIPLLRVGGLFIAMKGAEGTQEMEESGMALRELGSSIAEVVNLELPLGMGDRTLIVIKKDAPTKKCYPRRAGTPSKKPL